MAKQQHAAQQQELQLFWELRRERRNTNIKRVQQADVFRFFFVPVTTDVCSFPPFMLFGLVSFQPAEVKVKAVLVYMMAGALLCCAVDSGLICGPRVSGV